MNLKMNQVGTFKVLKNNHFLMVFFSNYNYYSYLIQNKSYKLLFDFILYSCFLIGCTLTHAIIIII